MKVTQVLLKHHIGWNFKKNWHVQGRRKPIMTDAEKVLKRRGVRIEDPKEFLREKMTFEKVEVVGFKPKPILLNETHPNWHKRTLLTYTDNNVLLEGLDQAKILTNTVEIKEGLPDSFQLPDISKELNKKVKQLVLSSHVFDAEQKKLPKVKDPERPAWNFPRTYGITQERVFNLLISRFLKLIENTTSHNLVKERYLSNDLFFSFPFEKDGDLIQLRLSGDFVLTSAKALSPPTASESAKEIALPNIYPVKSTITLEENNIYVLEDLYPFKPNTVKHHPHTLFLNFNKEQVKNVFEEEVTETQIVGRSLLKTFTAAASYARQQFGSDVKNLPTPVALQCVQTDGKKFYFGALQLNTLDLSNPDVKNVWFQTPALSLFDSCQYELGKPILTGYNKDVVRHLIGFYNSV